MERLFSNKLVRLLLVIIVAGLLLFGIATMFKNRASKTEDLANSLHTSQETITPIHPLLAILPYYQPDYSVIYREDYSSGKLIVVPILITKPGASPDELTAARNAMLTYFNQHGIESGKYFVEYTSDFLTMKHPQIDQD